MRHASLVAVCDADPLSLKDHVSVANRICCNLSSIPLSDDSVDFITCAMVIEHLSAPLACLKELARTLDKGGRLDDFTPRIHAGYPTVLARLSKAIPRAVRGGG